MWGACLIYSFDFRRTPNLNQWIEDKKFVKAWFKNAVDEVSDKSFQTFLIHSEKQLQSHWSKDEGMAHVTIKRYISEYLSQKIFAFV